MPQGNIKGNLTDLWSKIILSCHNLLKFQWACRIDKAHLMCCPKSFENEGNVVANNTVDCMQENSKEAKHKETWTCSACSITWEIDTEIQLQNYYMYT